ncbi:hypothetical protein E2C01_072521 [Portunus trituberculatus]|uniref:Uncharacterized protein n=1 Tax=Portunus trituberculatus TaxID=210409 RepID=A0A5B7IAY8_PORTR|nr:hypothetical protein [Portunus trituberculatus]
MQPSTVPHVLTRLGLDTPRCLHYWARAEPLLLATSTAPPSLARHGARVYSTVCFVISCYTILIFCMNFCVDGGTKPLRLQDTVMGGAERCPAKHY